MNKLPLYTMVLRFSKPFRGLVIGSSCTGKTYLVRQAILRREFGSKDDIEIIVYSPVLSSLKQPIWNDLFVRGFMIKKFLCDKTKKPVLPKPTDKRHRIIIIDDADQVHRLGKNGCEFVSELFGTESHHSDCSVILISHKLATGCPDARSSADFVIITGFPEPDLITVCKDLHLDFEIVNRTLNNPEGIINKSDEYSPCFNNVVISRKVLYNTKNHEKAPIYFVLPTKLSDTNVGLVPIPQNF